MARIIYRLKHLKHKVGFAAIVIFVFLFAGCSGGGRGGTETETPPGYRVLIDDLGKKVVLPEKIERAISLAPSVTETVFAAGAGDRLVGVTTFCNYPDESQKIAKVGDTQTPNLERIIALEPQVVLVTTASQLEGFTKILDGKNIAVFVSDPHDLESVSKNLRTLGSIFGTEEMAERSAESLEKRIRSLSERTRGAKQVRLFVQVSEKPLFTIGKGSFLTSAVQIAGGKSVTADVPQAYPELSLETAAALAPEAILISESSDNRKPNAAFKDSPAVRDGSVFRINADILVRPGPRVAEALELLARSLHPELFK